MAKERSRRIVDWLPLSPLRHPAGWESKTQPTRWCGYPCWTTLNHLCPAMRTWQPQFLGRMTSDGLRSWDNCRVLSNPPSVVSAWASRRGCPRDPSFRFPKAGEYSGTGTGAMGQAWRFLSENCRSDHLSRRIFHVSILQGHLDTPIFGIMHARSSWPCCSG